ncbi:MAG TPA: serine hydrolase domain-containing protein [Pyrinomonadaceae bacterium]|nr:serine hydrolase domain-containing protein [Pyrinomonadaceae bacterium]
MTLIARTNPLLLVLLLITASPAQADKVDDYVRSEMSKRRIPGLSLAVVKAGRVIKAKGYGLSDMELNVPATPDSVYQIGSMTKQFLRATYFRVVFLTLSWSLSVAAQADKWQRVYTAEEFIVDVKPSTLTYQPGGVLRLQFRTSFSKPEQLNGNSKYKTRLETIEFRADKRYRYYETVLLDATGKAVATYPLAQDWKTFKPGGVTNRLFDFGMSLPPFGYWNVTTYHYADGNPKDSDSESREITNFRGTDVILQFNGAAVGTERCSSPSYESHALADKDFYRKLGISLEPLGVVATQGDAVVLKCESHDWAPAPSLILPLPSGNMLLLWKGVFLELKKRRH